MSTEQDWKQFDKQTDDDLSALLNVSKISKITSQNPLIKIKRNLLINMIWGTVICCFYMIIIWKFSFWEVRAAIGAVLIFSLWALATGFIQYKSIDTAVYAGSSVLTELKRQQQSILKWTRAQASAGLFIYPVSAAGGFMLGGAIGSGKPVSVFMSKPTVVVIFLLVTALLTPACHYLAKWMCKRSFGQHLDTLQKNIEELETEA